MYAKIRARGRVVGKLQLLGAKFQKDASLLFLFTTTREEVAYMCEGAFGSVERMFDANGHFGTSFIGEKRTGRDESGTTAAEKMHFLKHFAECIEKRIEANLASQERSRS